MCVLGRWCDAAKIQWALLRKKKPRNEVRSLDMLGVGFGWQRQMRIGTFYQTKKKKIKNIEKWHINFMEKSSYVQLTYTKRTHTHIKQSTNNHIIDLYWVNRFTWFPMTMDGTVPSSLSAVVFGFVIVCIFMSRTNMLRELMAYGRCDNNNSEQRTATVHETIAANDVSFAYFRLRLIDSQFKWHKSKLCYVVCRNFKSIFSNSNKTVHSNRNRKC